MNRANAEKLAAYLDELPDSEICTPEGIALHCGNLFNDGRLSISAMQRYLGLSYGQAISLCVSEEAALIAPEFEHPWDWWGMKDFTHATTRAASRAVRRAIELWCK